MMPKHLCIGLNVILCIVLAGSVTKAQDSPPDVVLSYIENPTASAVAWSSDGDYLAVGDSAGVKIYTQNLQLVHQLPLMTEQMKTLQWSPDGAMLAAGGGNDLGTDNRDEPFEKTIYVWDTRTWELLTRYDDHEANVPSIAWSPDGSLIASGSWDRTIRIWEPQNGRTRYILFAPEDDRDISYIFSMDWSKAGWIAASIGSRGAFLWSSFSERPLQLAPQAGAVSWDTDGTRLTLGSGYVSLNDHAIHDMRECTLSGLTEWSPDGQWYATYTWYNGVQVCDPENDQVVAYFEASLNLEAIFGYQDSLSWHPDGGLLAGAGGDGFVRIWDVSGLTSNP